MDKFELTRAVIITGNARYERILDNRYMRQPIWKLTTATMAQLESEQFLMQHGFRRIE